MTHPSNNELPWKLLVKDDGVFLYLKKDYPAFWPALDKESLINLGPYNQVAEAMASFWEQQDFGEVMK
jgi:hypothetical protein